MFFMDIYIYIFITIHKWEKSGERKEWEDSKEREDKIDRNDFYIQNNLIILPALNYKAFIQLHQYHMIKCLY
jgi:hypothetical protein